jgi:hypothetical protein
LIQITVKVCAVIWAIWNTRNDFIFNKPKTSLFLQVILYGHPLDPYMVLSPTRGGGDGDDFWVQPFGNGCSGFIQPMRLTVA